MATDMGVNFLGSLPLDPALGKCCDEGKSLFEEAPTSALVTAYNNIITSKTLLLLLVTVNDVISTEIVSYCSKNETSS